MSAIGGLGIGLAQGLKLGTDIAESAQRSQLIGMQVKQLQRDNDEKDQIAAVAKKWTGVVPTAAAPQEGGSPQPQAASDRIESPITEGSTAAPAAIAEPSTAAAPTPAAGVGIATPKAAPTASANLIDGKPFDMNNLDHLSKMNAEINAVRASFGKISPLEIAQQSESFSKLKTSGAFRAAQDFITHGDAEKARAEFAKAGYSFPEGTNFEVKNTPLFPGAPPSKNVVVTTPDGRTFESNSLMRGAMDIKDVAAYDLNLANAAADVQYKFAMIGETAKHNRATEKIAADTLAQTTKYQNADLFIKENAQLHREYTDKEQLAISRENMDATLSRVQSLQKQGEAQIKLANAQFDALKEEKARKAGLEEAAISHKNLARFSGHDLSVTDKTIAAWKELGTPESKKMLVQYEANMSKWLNLLEARELNLDPETKKQRFTDVELAALARENPKLDYTYNKNIGLWSAQYRGKELFVTQGANDPNAKMTSAIPLPAQPAPAGANASPKGIKPVGDPNAPLPAGLSPDVNARAGAIKESDAAAKTQRESAAAASAAASKQLTQEAAGLTAERIRALKPSEAREMIQRYGTVLSPEQRKLLNTRL